jgi:hypothetical protein
MITFSVVKEPHGWAIRMGDRMTTPYWSRDFAVREANCLADAIRRHGEPTEVIVQASPGPARDGACEADVFSASEDLPGRSRGPGRVIAARPGEEHAT